jgi:hypothetical protein
MHPDRLHASFVFITTHGFNTPFIFYTFLQSTHRRRQQLHTVVVDYHLIAHLNRSACFGFPFHWPRIPPRTNRNTHITPSFLLSYSAIPFTSRGVSRRSLATTKSHRHHTTPHNNQHKLNLPKSTRTNMRTPQNQHARTCARLYTHAHQHRYTIHTRIHRLS